MSQVDAGAFNPYDAGGEPPKTSLLAVSGFVSSLIFCCPLTSLVGLLLGVGGLVSVSSSNGRRKGTGLAAAAIIISIVSMAGQIWFAQKLVPYFQGVGRIVVLSMVGPQPLISDLQLGDIESARTYLYPPLDEVITDGQLQYFADQITERYGAVQEWVPQQYSPQTTSGTGEQTINLTSQLNFANQTCRASIQISFFQGPNGMIEQSGISQITIEDKDLGDLVLDKDAPGAGEVPGDGTEEPVEEPGEGGGG